MVTAQLGFGVTKEASELEQPYVCCFLKVFLRQGWRVVVYCVYPRRPGRVQTTCGVVGGGQWSVMQVVV
jgi:hypothetical protein